MAHNTIKKINICIRNEMSHAFSYTFSYFFAWFLAILGLSMLYFLPNILKRQFTFSLNGYSLSYFNYIISGVLINMFCVSSVQSLVHRLEKARGLGFFESVLQTPTPLIIVVLAMYLERLLFYIFVNIPFLLLGVYFLRTAIHNPNIGALIIIIVLAQVIFFSLALLLASYVIIFEHAVFLSNAIFNFFRVFCNILFPVTILTKGFRIVSDCIPVSYVFRSFRDALFNGNVATLKSDILFLGVFAFVGLFFSVLVFHYSVKKSRAWGTLSSY